jgi:uncharacterized protein involved in response to NO
MMLAIMNRSIRLHTGQNGKLSWPLRLSVPSVLFAAGFRSVADLIPGLHEALIGMAGMFWIAAFVFFLCDSADLLCHVQRQPGRQLSPPTRINIR